MPHQPKWPVSWGRSPGYKRNATSMLRVMRNHRNAAYGESDGYEDLAIKPVPLDHANCPDQTLVAHVKTEPGIQR